MQYITGTNRTQAVLFSQSLDEIIDCGNEVRIIDLFVESIDLAQFTFHLKSATEGRPPYHPKDLLKLYVYGYLNSIRSSRALEKECKRNIELMWLMRQLVPDHNTISNFRKDNEKAIRQVYNFDKFIYNNNDDTYTCPQQQTLITNGNWYQKSKQRYIYYVKHYKTHVCATCPALSQCTKNKKGRLLERSEYQPYVEQNKQNIEANTETYKKRQAIIEHTYGIIKRQWGYYFISTKKGIKNASADVGLMFTALNLRRLMNIIDKNAFKKFLVELVQLFFVQMAFIKSLLGRNKPLLFSHLFQFAFYKHLLKER